MSDHSAIGWTQATWNPTTGCDRISAGCDHCYALTLAKRLKGMGSPKYQNDGDPRTSGPGFGITIHPSALDIPRRWREPRLVFVNSMSDLFHARVPLSFISQVFAVMAETPQHTYQVLTKRATRLPRIADKLNWPPNLWMGVSVEDQEQAGIRIPALLSTPTMHWISAEPLLGLINLKQAVIPMGSERGHGLTASYVHAGDCCRKFHGLDWVVVGGESGPNHRTMNLTWATDLIAQCQAAGVPVFVKQDSGAKAGSQGRIPNELWIHQYPERAA